MKIRNELANKSRTVSDNKAGASVVGKSFKGQVQKMSTPVVIGSSKPWSHHTKSSHAKNISLEQANRLAGYAPAIQESSRKYNVPVELICAVILQESGGNPKAVSPAGAKGLMQLMPATARRFGVVNSFDARQNIDGGTKYLRFLMDRFKGDYKLVLAGYNAGEANVEKYGNKIPPFAETKAYVPNVLAYADTIYQILRSPPQVASATLPPHARKV
jgi:soluble lytic murein transglycosylase-like protein